GDDETNINAQVLKDNKIDLPDPVKAPPDAANGMMARSGRADAAANDLIAAFSKNPDADLAEHVRLVQKKRKSLKSKKIIPIYTDVASRITKNIQTYYSLIADGSGVSEKNAEKLKSLASSPAWAPIVGDKAPSNDIVDGVLEVSLRMERVGNRVVQAAELEKNKQAKSGELKDKLRAAGGDRDTYKSGAAVTGTSLSLAVVISFLKDLSENTSVSDIWGLAVDTFWGVLGTISAVFPLGKATYDAAYLMRNRQSVYAKQMKKSGFTKDTDPKQAEKAAERGTDAEKNRVKLGKIAQYAHAKSFRGYVQAIFKFVSIATTWLMGLITVLTGGAGIIFTGGVAAAASIGNSMRILGNKARGIYKFFRGKRGKNRKVNARELLVMAMNGDDDAIQTIWDVDPFDHLMIYPKKGGNIIAYRAHFTKSEEHLSVLIRPESIESFKAQLTGKEEGLYSQEKTQRALAAVLKDTMRSSI
ncbi:MAG: hypothetical protein AAF125_09025, partial [Chloroflexota bacterium]